MSTLLRMFTRWRQRCNDETEIVAILVAVKYLEMRGRHDWAARLRDYATGLAERFNEIHCKPSRR